MKWTDVYDIGYELFEAHSDVDPLSVRFTDLASMVRALDEFDDAWADNIDTHTDPVRECWLLGVGLKLTIVGEFNDPVGYGNLLRPHTNCD